MQYREAMLRAAEFLLRRYLERKPVTTAHATCITRALEEYNDGNYDAADKWFLKGKPLRPVPYEEKGEEKITEGATLRLFEIKARGKEPITAVVSSPGDDDFVIFELVRKIGGGPAFIKRLGERYSEVTTYSL